MDISACMIAKNEERCIARCIQSYKNVVGEVIVGDTGSTDKTVAIAKGLGAKVVDIPWTDDFAAAKNAVLAHAKGDWVVFLDADQYFEPGGAKALAKMLEKMPAGVDALGMREVNFVREGEPPAYTMVMRVFRNSPAIRYHRPIHEQLLKNGQPLVVRDAPPDKLVVLHDGYMGGAAARKKAARNLEILTALADGGDQDPMLLYYMGQSREAMRDWAGALRDSRAFLEAYGENIPVVLTALLRCEAAARMLGPGLLGGEAEYAALRAALADEAERRFPAHPAAALMAANARFELGDVQDALPLYEQAVERFKAFDGGAESSMNAGRQLVCLASLRLAACLLAAGKTEKAKGVCEAALAIDPDIPGGPGLYLAATRGLPADQAAAAAVEWFDAAKDKPAWLQAAKDARCDVVYLFLYDRLNKGGPPRRNADFTAMQVAVGEYGAAVDDALARVTGHPLWRGGFEASFGGLDAAAKRELEDTLAEGAVAALFTCEAEWLLRLAFACPPALQDALRLAAGEELETARGEGANMLALVERRLAAQKAGEELKGLWREVMGCF